MKKNIIQPFQEIVDWLESITNSITNTPAIEIEDVGIADIEKVRTDYPRVLKGKNIGQLKICDVTITAVSLAEVSAVLPLIKELVQYLKGTDKPAKSRLSKIIDALKPWGSWASVTLKLLEIGGLF